MGLGTPEKGTGLAGDAPEKSPRGRLNSALTSTGIKSKLRCDRGAGAERVCGTKTCILQ